jgi:sugar lactone lactonase YvrE
LFAPWSVAVDGAGNILIADHNNQRIRRVSPAGIISTVAGNGTRPTGVAGDGGPAINAMLNLSIGSVTSAGVAVDSAGNVFIADTANHRIRKVTPDGIINTVAGVGPPCSAPGDCLPLGDGGPASSATLSNPTSLAVDGKGNLFISDAGNGRIRKMTPDGMIATVASFTGNLAADRDGNLFVARGFISKIAPDGTISTVAGGGLLCNDYGECPPDADVEPAVGARLNASAVTVDDAGNLFIADAQETDSYSNCRVRRITPDGLMRTIVGGVCSYPWRNAGNGPIGYLSGLFVDNLGNLFATDVYNQFVRQISPEGVIRNIAGGAYGYSGDNGPATNAAMRYAVSLAGGADGNLYFGDSANNVIRVLKPVR